MVAALVGPDLVVTTVHGTTEKARAAVASGLEEEALLVVCRSGIALVEDGGVHRLPLVPPARIRSAQTRGQPVSPCVVHL